MGSGIGVPIGSFGRDGVGTETFITLIRNQIKCTVLYRYQRMSLRNVKPAETVV